MNYATYDLSYKFPSVTKEDETSRIVHRFKTLDPSKERGSYSFYAICVRVVTQKQSGVAHLSRPQTSLWVMPDNSLTSNRYYGGCPIHLVRPTCHAGQPYKTLHPLFKSRLNPSKRPNLTRFIINIGKHMNPMRVRSLLTDKAARKLVNQHLEGWRIIARKPRPSLG